jgi:hypothetical protein
MEIRNICVILIIQPGKRKRKWNHNSQIDMKGTAYESLAWIRWGINKKEFVDQLSEHQFLKRTLLNGADVTYSVISALFYM